MKLYDNDEYRNEFMELVYSLLHSDGTNDRANQIINAFDSAPAVEAEPVLPNDPLTLEELREMDGEPVWVTIDKHGFPYIRAYGIMSCERDRVEGYSFSLCLKDYGLWLAYRHRPEVETE